jgi:hypothetical protein
VRHYPPHTAPAADLLPQPTHRTPDHELNPGASADSRVSTRPDSRGDGGGGSGGSNRRSATPSLYRSRFQAAAAAAAQHSDGGSWAHQGGPPPITPGGESHDRVEVVELGDEAATVPLHLSDKELLRYEHEQSQMELMEYIAQLSTVRSATATSPLVLALPQPACAAEPTLLSGIARVLLPRVVLQGSYGNQFEYLTPMQIDDFPANPYHLKVCRLCSVCLPAWSLLVCDGFSHRSYACSDDVAHPMPTCVYAHADCAPWGRG